MKKAVLLLILIALFSFNGNSQSSLTKDQYRNIDSWMISVGVNAVGSLGTRNPVERLDEFEFSQPLALAVEHQWSRFLSIEQDFTLNKFKITSRIDNGKLPEEFTYFSTNTYLKYYYSNEIFKNTNLNWLDLYVGGGLGVFSIDEINTSANLLLGGTIWISDNIGIRLQGVGKFAFNHKDNRFDNNHFQYMLQGIFKL
ncbi:hypothetical protein [uncultured Psychroserpens sp.]|uniref:hypothetical protein n=1 Tax=uncultured Psychroserpens sp. TaxID=255436 RepID=UPI002609F2B8|nr:hypothetical protein [uncultured Psychroserpens sp.]